jgi:hypothetical protein
LRLTFANDKCDLLKSDDGTFFVNKSGPAPNKPGPVPNKHGPVPNKSFSKQVLKKWDYPNIRNLFVYI